MPIRHGRKKEIGDPSTRRYVWMKIKKTEIFLTRPACFRSRTSQRPRGGAFSRLLLVVRRIRWERCSIEFTKDNAEQEEKICSASDDTYLNFQRRVSSPRTIRSSFNELSSSRWKRHTSTPARIMISLSLLSARARHRIYLEFRTNFITNLTLNSLSFRRSESWAKLNNRDYRLYYIFSYKDISDESEVIIYSLTRIYSIQFSRICYIPCTIYENAIYVTVSNKKRKKYKLIVK